MRKEFTPINGQMLCPYADMHFGLRKLKHNGCAVIALYNALGLSGRPACISDIIDTLGNSWNGRLFGVLPHEIAACLVHYGVTYQRISSSEELSDKLRNGGIAIVTRWNHLQRLFGIPNVFKGAHTMAISCDDKGICRVYNRYSNSSVLKEYTNFDAFMNSERCYIAGFYISNQY